MRRNAPRSHCNWTEGGREIAAVGFRFPQPAIEFSAARRGLSKSDQTDALDEDKNHIDTWYASPRKRSKFERARNERPCPKGATISDVNAYGINVSGPQNERPCRKGATMSDVNASGINVSGLSDNAAGGLSYVTIIPAIVFLIA